MKPLAGKTALVTGATQGIGRAIVLALADAGATVWINHLDQPEAAAALVARIAADGGRAHAVQADVASPVQVADMFGWVLAEDDLDILVNNAGIILEKPFLDIGEEEWARVLGVDLHAVYRCCRHALAHMQARGEGCIVNIASELGQIGRERYAAYCAAKAGVIGLTKALAREFAPAIRINAVAPGPVDTPMVSVEHMSAEMVARETAIPAGRLGRPEEIAAAVLFLASAGAGFFHGQTLGANGGAWMGG
ncbi:MULTISPECIES: 3-oxoacyl-ACP reductase FabG [unclassified Pseudomonas]|uniref:SDR family NAD(P)-dependent oxidoreductase n=1 Tax=unclassified Pseudomonas TaxID=196821 RepID=UPI002448D110|nr:MULTISPECIES: 3-oxoacyl-ACP reductase FabG [unclassified Pseudomonas]MDG9928073.1 3-oxoacyl-ACP reductase FabG [Pseudomonas sp. GD04042]MDH0482082.1 3-oxoacyl-ACP reductase FabG [Pseudomonas sp. GD04015]MDH0604023.1 3-oxoacyl-ACP reductase FabG [Pseudomonas sp. GD03869]